MRITVEVKSSYGSDLVYPACETSRMLAELIGAKTFTPAKLAIIRRLGYEVTAKAPAVPVLP